MRWGRTRRAAIFGCGPAGLFAAHALVKKGWDFDIFSKRRKSEVYGAQYLHMGIPGLVDETDRREIHYTFEGGSVENYLMKVYGKLPPLGELRWAQGTLSEEPRPAWNLRAAYDRAWERYFRYIIPANLSADWLLDPPHPFRLSDYDLILSTVPAKALCNVESHEFASKFVWAVGDAPERGIFVPFRAPEDTIVYNATPDTGWYRSSTVFGYSTVEWPHGRKPPVEQVAEVEKPLHNSCSCWIEHPRFFRLGRYGAWSKEQHTHHAYDRTLELVT